MDPLEQARAYFMQALEHHNQQRLGQAEDLYRKALALAPERLSIMVNLAVVLASTQQFAEAKALGERALAVEPGHLDAQVVVATCLRAMASPREAADVLAAVAAQRPDDARSHNNLGIVLEELGQTEAAAQRHEQALRLAPDDVGSVILRCMSMARAGSASDAFGLLKPLLRDVSVQPAAGAAFVQLVLDAGFVDAVDPDYRRHLISAISAPWCRPPQIAPALVAVLRADPRIDRIACDAENAWPNRLTLAESDLGALLDNDVLLALLTHAPVADLPLERLLSALRLQLSKIDAAASGGGALLELHCALARQCFINEYVYSLDQSELAEARSLRQRCELALRVGMDPTGHSLATMGSYFPLSNLPGIEVLPAREWPHAVASLLSQQVIEPAKERAARASLERLTDITDPVSREVRAQYERNPYPRWTGTPAPVQRQSLAGYLQHRFPSSAYRPPVPAGSLAVLNAGCGTGQHPIETARRFQDAQVLAVDLSESSLAYAIRKAAEFAVENIRFAQADLLELPPSLGPFDLIEADGVLHHLADPARGLERLVSHLRPHGVMKLALYSERARASVVAARNYIAERGFAPLPEGIRACRDGIAAMPRDSQVGRVAGIADFYTLSECRDLIFHVQEHRFVPQQIGRLLADAGLAFIGFELNEAQLRAFREAFADSRSLYHLDAWDTLEQQSPDLFIGMYQFWAQRLD